MADVGTPEHALRAMLRAGADLDPIYPHPQFGGLTDHLPMALQALWRLGASQTQLEEFRTRYVRQLVPVVTRTPVSVAGTDWQASLGQWRIYLPLRARLLTDIAAHGRDAVLREWLPRFIDIVAIDAFHPLIRTAYGIEQGIDEEIAAGLAYWAASYVPAPPIDHSQVGSGADMTELLARVKSTSALKKLRFKGASFNDRLLQLCAMPEFALASGWRNKQVNLRGMAQEAARIYLTTQDFFALHMVTGTQAVRMLMPYLDDVENALQRCWQALAGAYLIIGAPVYDARSPLDTSLPPPAAESILAAVLRARDDQEHVAKLAHSAAVELACWQLPEHVQILRGIVRRFAA